MSDIEGNEPLVGAQYLELRRTDVVGACVELAERAAKSGRNVVFILNGCSVWAFPGDSWGICFDRWLALRDRKRVVAFDARRSYERIKAMWPQDQPKPIPAAVRQESKTRRIILFDAD